MKILRRFLLIEFVVFFIPVFVGLSFLILTQKFTKIFSETSGIKDILLTLKITLYLAPTILNISLPVSFLVALSITLTKLSAANEMLSLSFARISGVRILKILLGITFFFVITHYLISNFIRPASNLRLRGVLNNALVDSKIDSTKEKLFNKISDNLYLYFDEKQGNILKNAVLIDKKGREVINVLGADICKFFKNSGTTILNFQNGNLIRYKSDEVTEIEFANFTLIANDLNRQKGEDSVNYSMVPTKFLVQSAFYSENRVDVMNELLRRLVIPLINLSFLLLTLTLSIKKQKDFKTYGILISSLVGLSIFIIISLSKNLMKIDILLGVTGYLTAITFPILLGFILLKKKGFFAK